MNEGGLIQNYGLFWYANKVFWGKPTVAGTLFGKDANYLSGDAVDFREQQGVYVLYDENYRLLYVGQAGCGRARLFDRLRSHRKGPLADRWARFSWFGLCPVEDYRLQKNKTSGTTSVDDVLNHIEGVLISAVEPPLNRQGGRFAGGKQYRQHWDDHNLGLTQQEMINELWQASNLKKSD